MRIAINTRFLMPGQLEGYGYFIQEICRRMVQSHPQHEFIFIFDRPFDRRFIFSENVRGIVSGPPARHPVLWKLWYDIKLPYLLKKYKADLFFSPDGFCSLNTNVPQCMVVHDLAFLHFPTHLPAPQSWYLKRYTPRFLEKANLLTTVSEFSKTDIIAQYNIDPAKIKVVYSAAKGIFHPINDSEKAAIKEKYSAGKDYFIYTGAIHPRKNLMNLLRAFSIFKKKLQSNFKLIIAGRLAWQNDSFKKSLSSYKYRDDVVMTGYIPEAELTGLMGAAYGLTYISKWEGFGVPVLEAMRSGVPVITAKGSAMQEIAGDAALYADPDNVEEIASVMMTLYKDESLRARLIEKGYKVEPGFTWDRSADLVWEALMKTANGK